MLAFLPCAPRIARSAASTCATVGPLGPVDMGTATGPTRLEIACALPTALCAVTVTRINPPSSAVVSVYELPVAPAMSEHAGLHRCHWYV